MSAEADRALRFVMATVRKAMAAFAEDPDRQSRDIILVVVAHDPAARAFYEAIASTPGSPLPPTIEPRSVGVVGVPYSAFLQLAAVHYAMDPPSIGPLDPYTVRIAVLVEGTVHMRDAQLPGRKLAPKARGARIDWLIGRVLESARDVVLESARRVRETEEFRHADCLLVVHGRDTVALAFYMACVQAGMAGPPLLKADMITTLRESFVPLMEMAAQHYAMTTHIEAPLGADEVRAVVLTLGTLTVVRLGADATPYHASPSYRPLQPDVLLLAVACWRNDLPEGFKLQGVFQTREQGERFLAHYEAQLAELVASGPSREVIEEELLRFKPTYAGRDDVPIEVQARAYAQVGWLETAGFLPDDPFNGLAFTYGCEMDLESASELARQLGGPSDHLS